MQQGTLDQGKAKGSQGVSESPAKLSLVQLNLPVYLFRSICVSASR